MKPFNLLNNKHHGKENPQKAKSRPSLKTQIIIFWLVFKILVDKIMIILPESYEDNGFYVAQSVWMLILFILMFNAIEKFYKLIAIIALIIYQLGETMIEVNILLGKMNVNDAMPAMWGLTGLVFVILSALSISKYFPKNDY